MADTLGTDVAKGPGGGAAHFLVTAGPTRERIDEVREWGNIFSGNTGRDLAMAFLELGNVTLLTSNEAHVRELDGFSGKGGMIGAEVFSSHADLRGLLSERMTSGDRVDAVAMTAAVSDYEPAGVYRVVARKLKTQNAKLKTEGAEGGAEIWEVENVSAGKVKSSYDEIAVVGERTEKLVDLFRGAWGFKGVLIKFKLEVGVSEEELVEIAEASREASGADLMVANTLEMARPVAGGEGAAYLIEAGAGGAGAVRVSRGGVGEADCGVDGGAAAGGVGAREGTRRRRRAAGRGFLFADVFGVGDAGDADAGGVGGIVAVEDGVPFELIFDGDKFAPDGWAFGVELGIFDGDFAHLAAGEFFAVDLNGEAEVFEEGFFLGENGGGSGERVAAE